MSTKSEGVTDRIVVKGPDEAAHNAALARVEAAQRNLASEEALLEELQTEATEDPDIRRRVVARLAAQEQVKVLETRRKAVEAARRSLRPFELDPALAVAAARALLGYVGEDVPVVATTGTLPKVDRESLPKLTVTVVEEGRWLAVYDVPEQWRTLGCDNPLFERNLEGALNRQDIALSRGATIHVGESVIDGVRRQTITTPVPVRYVPGSYQQHLLRTAINDPREAARRAELAEQNMIPVPGSTIFG